MEANVLSAAHIFIHILYIYIYLDTVSVVADPNMRNQAFGAYLPAAKGIKSISLSLSLSLSLFICA